MRTRVWKNSALLATAACVAASVFLSSCAEVSDRGNEGKPCFNNKTCLDELLCVEQNSNWICVKPGQTDGGTDSGMDVLHNGSPPRRGLG
jgi:hypothetical protein